MISISGLIKGNLSVLRKVNILELRKVKVSVTELLDKKAKNAIIAIKKKQKEAFIKSLQG